MKSTVVYCWLALLVTAPFMQGAQVPQPQNAASKASIQGSVTKAGGGQPLKGVRISFRRLDGSQNPFGNVRTPVATDATGRFLVTGVDPGQYRISAERDGYIRQEYGQRTTTGSGTVISVAAGQRLELQFQMLPAGVISGRVSDERGEPAARGEIQAWAFQYADGKRSLSQVANAQTNDIGEYRLFWLPPGEYLISVTVPDAGESATANLSAPPTGASLAVSEFVTAIGAAGGLPQGLDGDALQRVAQVFEGREPAQIYFPGTLDPDSAAPIKLGAAVEMRAIDFTLRSIRTVTVRGRVVAPFPLAQAGGGGRQGGPFALAFGQGTQVSLSRAGARPGFAALGLGGTSVNADGSFEIRGVAAGSYNLTATARPPDGQPYSARARVEVGDADVSNVVITVRPNISIRGSLAIDSAPQQFRMSQLRVSLVPADGPSIGPTAVTAELGGRGGANIVLPMIGGANADVAEDGAFTLQNVAAQEYRLLVTGLPAGTYLVAGRFGSADVLNGPFVPAENERNSLQLQLGSTPGRVSGIVRDAKGNPYAGALAALVPDESRRGRTDLYSSIPTDQSGRFSFNNVAPGNYRIFAWEEIPTGAYQDPDYIRRFESRGKPVVVQQSGSTEIEVSLIPAN
jgi:protocatechuate 3,4-dioxygenase beta subunit